MKISELTRIAEEVGAEALTKANRAKGWNLICGLYSEPHSPDEDLAHAYASEARELSLLGLRLTCARTEAGLKGNTKRYDSLTKAIEEISKRELHLSALCLEAIRHASNRKENQ